MVTRIVKMTFHEDKLDEFKHIFENSKDRIRGFSGCTYVELCNDINKPNVFFTYSHWDSEEALNEYRNSTFFKSTWNKTKALFKARPEAYSLHTIYSSDQIAQNDRTA